jgi:hypothetical protein
MKQLITIAALVGFASLSYGQGYVAFNNESNTRITTNAVAVGGGTGLTSITIGGEYYYALLVAPSTTTTIGASPQSLANDLAAAHRVRLTPFRPSKQALSSS